MNEDSRYDIELSAKAREQLDDISDYISYVLESPITAERMINGLIDKMRSLEFEPRRYLRMIDPGGEDIRRMLYKNYWVIYSVDEDSKVVIIHKVCHTSMNISET